MSPPVLLAGADARRRAALRHELDATLPSQTSFCEAGQVTEVLERAPRSRMVILTGDLDDADAESLVRMLGRRHPQLPVVHLYEPQVLPEPQARPEPQTWPEPQTRPEPQAWPEPQVWPARTEGCD